MLTRADDSRLYHAAVLEGGRWRDIDIRAANDVEAEERVQALAGDANFIGPDIVCVGEAPEVKGQPRQRYDTSDYEIVKRYIEIMQRMRNKAAATLLRTP